MRARAAIRESLLSYISPYKTDKILINIYKKGLDGSIDLKDIVFVEVRPPGHLTTNLILRLLFVSAVER